MRNNKTWKSVTIVVIIVLIFGIGFYSWYNYGTKSEGITADDIPTEPKHYEVNEYSSISISDQNMCKKYLNNYLNILSNDLNQAYNLLDEEYRNTKFGNFENFRNYINSKKYTFGEVASYSVVGNKYYIYDENNNQFIFSTDGVMTYKVYLDDTTVKID